MINIQHIKQNPLLRAREFYFKKMLLFVVKVVQYQLNNRLHQQLELPFIVYVLPTYDVAPGLNPKIFSHDYSMYRRPFTSLHSKNKQSL